MITASPRSRQHGGWQQELAQAVSDPHELCRLLELDPALARAAEKLGAEFRLRVPHSFVRRMRRGDPTDPLLRQVLPLAAEAHSPPQFCADPLGERTALAAPGLLHKYQGRALMIATGACAVHCRYCFRREFPYGEQLDGSGRWRAAIAAAAADPSILELILSGGDPLSLTNGRLAELTASLVAVPHLRRLRLHTRTPVVLPSRVDAGLTAWLSGLPWRIAIVLHVNHANEIDGATRAAFRELSATGATLLNQSVLLAGVNDSPAALRDLSEALWEAGVLPYYLHLLDRVRGTAHFEVDEARARAIAAELASNLPGYLVPRLVREVAGAPAKLPLTPGPWTSAGIDAARK
jgi:EF-P beta-lysylation protein EpmB